MKKAVCTLLLAGVATLAVADIQSPPAAKHGMIRKLSRAFANLAYGVSEIPANWVRVGDTEGRKAAGSYGVAKGVEKTVVRVGYGLYELITFPAPTYKQGYRPPYYKKMDKYPFLGYEEFPPQLGFITEAEYCRTQHP
jgi:putative exosortase-associated protein (TIGR04073 family)